jgi:hypothetical protein
MFADGSTGLSSCAFSQAKKGNQLWLFTQGTTRIKNTVAGDCILLVDANAPTATGNCAGSNAIWIKSYGEPSLLPPTSTSVTTDTVFTVSNVSPLSAGLSGGVIVGIVIGSLAGTLFIGGLIWLLAKRSHTEKVAELEYPIEKEIEKADEIVVQNDSLKPVNVLML